MHSRGRPLVAALAILGVVLGSDYALGQAGDDYIYCLRTGGDEYAKYDTYYYTAVFVGDYGWTLGHENDFYDFLKGNEPDRFFRHSYCFHEPTRERVERRIRDDVDDQARKRYHVIRTGWAPGGGRAHGGGGAFAPQPIRDVRVSVPSNPYDVEVCVRDHQCEDGDRVWVSVDGAELLGGEIFNRWQCRRVSLREGRHDIELYAVNGTGYKGECSYADGNTGELRVTGRDAQTQSWRHRGGQGSRANLEVIVRSP